MNRNNILQSFKIFIYEQVDPLVITQKLHNIRHLDATQKTLAFSLFRHSSSRKDVWDYLLPIIEKQCPLYYFLEVLLKCGYVELFINIGHQWRLSKHELVKMQRARILDSSRRSAQDLLMTLKIQTHNVQFGNPRKYLRQKSQMYKTEYLCETDDTQRMVKADKFAASLCAEIDAYTILYVRKFPSHGLFDELKKIIPHTSNTHVTQVAHDTRLALAYAIADQEDIGEDNLHNAMTASIHIGYCVELVEMLYIYVFTLLGMYEKYPSERLLDKIINIAEYCTQCLQEEHDNRITSFWKRRIYLRIIFCLLGISNRGDIMPGRIILPKNIRRANDLMVELDKLWDGFETRRLMFYYAAKARIAEVEEELEFAIECTSMAVDIGVEGEFGEAVYIEGYLNALKDKYLMSQEKEEYTSIFQQRCKTNEMQYEITFRTAIEHTDYTVTEEETLETFSDYTSEKEFHSKENIKGSNSEKITKFQMGIENLDQTTIKHSYTKKKL